MGNKHRVPLHPHKKRFLSFPTVVETSSDCGNVGSRLKHKLAQAGSRANQPTGSALSPTWSEKVHLHLPLGGVLREGTRCTVKPVGYEPNPNAALKPCRAATSLSDVDKNIKVRRLLVLKMYNMGPMDKQKTDKLKRRMRCWIGFWMK